MKIYCVVEYVEEFDDVNMRLVKAFKSEKSAKEWINLHFTNDTVTDKKIENFIGSDNPQRIALYNFIKDIPYDDINPDIDIFNEEEFANILHEYSPESRIYSKEKLTELFESESKNKLIQFYYNVQNISPVCYDIVALELED